MSINRLTDPKGKTNDLEIIRQGLGQLEDRTYSLVRDSETVMGPPTFGTHTQNETWVDSLWSVWLCLTGGTPGTWRQITPAVVSGALPTVSVPTGYELVWEDSGRRKYRWDGTSWGRINRYIHNQVSQQATWSVAHNLGYKPGSVTIWISGVMWMTRINHVDDDNLEAVFDTAQSGELIVE